MIVLVRDILTAAAAAADTGLYRSDTECPAKVHFKPKQFEKW